jgi:hypothetical protein
MKMISIPWTTMMRQMMTSKKFKRIYWKRRTGPTSVSDRHSSAFLDAQDYEHHEVKPMTTGPNPPIPNFHPSAKKPEEERLRPAQMYAIAWMDLRLEGGGIIGDFVGMGKVYYP